MIRTPLRTLPVLLLLAACARPAPRPIPPPPPAAPAPPPPVPEGPPTEVWTRKPGVVIRDSAHASVAPYLFMRLEVIRAEPDSLYVRCPACFGMPMGWVPAGETIHRAPPPGSAARGELAEMALFVRQAAVARDLEALRRVMSRDFIHSYAGGEGILEAVHAWQAHRAGDLARLPGLLDRGVASVDGTDVWAAPPEWVTVPGYADLRAGFRRGRDGWEWIFLVRAEP